MYLKSAVHLSSSLHWKNKPLWFSSPLMKPQSCVSEDPGGFVELDIILMWDQLNVASLSQLVPPACWDPFINTHLMAQGLLHQMQLWSCVIPSHQGIIKNHLRPRWSWPQSAALQDGSLGAGPLPSCRGKWEIKLSCPSLGTVLHLHVLQRQEFSLYLSDHFIKFSNLIIWMYLITDVCPSKWGHLKYIYKCFLQSQTLLVTVYMRQREGWGVTTTACSYFNPSHSWCKSSSAKRLLTHIRIIFCCSCLILSNKRWVGGGKHRRSKKMNLERSTAEEHIYIHKICAHVYPENLCCLQAHP